MALKPWRWPQGRGRNLSFPAIKVLGAFVGLVVTWVVTWVFRPTRNPHLTGRMRVKVLVRVRGIEPRFQAWEAHVIAVILHPRRYGIDEKGLRLGGNTENAGGANPDEPPSPRLWSSGVAATPVRSGTPSGRALPHESGNSMSPADCSRGGRPARSSASRGRHKARRRRSAGRSRSAKLSPRCPPADAASIVAGRLALDVVGQRQNQLPTPPPATRASRDARFRCSGPTPWIGDSFPCRT